MRQAGWGLAMLFMACDQPLPSAGLISEENADRVLLHGPVASGSLGDFYLKNDRLMAVIQKPGRVFGVGPYGGNLIDLGDSRLRQDALGETIPFIQMGLTADFATVRVVDDGSSGAPAVIARPATGITTHPIRCTLRDGRV